MTIPTTGSGRAAENLAKVMSGGHLPALDGLRCLGCILVIATHGGYQAYGDLGLLAFFVFSGLLITWLLLREHDETGGISLRRFYVRRTLRIFPAYYAFLVFSIVMDRLRGDPRIDDLILPAWFYGLNYWQAFNGHSTASIAHAWSLAVEEQFYVLWPLGLILLLRVGGRKAAARGLVAVCALTLIWRLVVHFGLRLPEYYTYNAFDTRMDSLLIGCLLAVLLTTPDARAALGRLAPSAWWALATLAALLCSRMLGSESYHLTLGLTVDALLIGALIVQMFAHSGHWAFRWLERRPIRFVGGVTYPMYLYHQWALSVAGRVPGAPRWLVVTLGVVAAIVFGMVSWYLIEKPALRLRARVTRWVQGKHPLVRTAVTEGG